MATERICAGGAQSWRCRGNVLPEYLQEYFKLAPIKPSSIAELNDAWEIIDELDDPWIVGARKLMANGYAVLPVDLINDVKKPLMYDWSNRAVTTADQLLDCDYGDAQWGIQTKDILVLDIEAEALDWLYKRNRWLLKLAGMIVRSGGGGLHLYWQLPKGIEGKQLIRLNDEPIDIKSGDGCYVIAPGSAFGPKRYCIRRPRNNKLMPLWRLPEVPPALIDMIMQDEKRRKIKDRIFKRKIRQSTKNTRSMIDRRSKIIAAMCPITAARHGSRHDGVTKLTGMLIRTGISRDDLLDIMMDVVEKKMVPPSSDLARDEQKILDMWEKWHE
ncbi:MAG: hypothetical protein DRJ64_00630 [Thermoprotei archaeon]|nr:MAG: hypothetical protein DRJ64_00630 [Thermoprotei archaeon]